MLLQLLAVSLLASTSPPSAPPVVVQTSNTQASSNVYAAQIRAHLLAQPNFDTQVPPLSDRAKFSVVNGAPFYSLSGTDVSVQTRFFKVLAVTPSQATMSIKIWMRMAWKDERLAWNAPDFGNVTQTWFRADQSVGSEASEIWLPDLQPYNAQTGFVSTLEPGVARVDSDGSVFWSRPGTLDVLCRFSGLVSFPKDTLVCKVEVGGWTWSGGQQGVHLLNGGYEFSSQEVTAGSSYQELTIANVTAEIDLLSYGGSAAEPWPVLRYTITMHREPLAYYFLVIFPGVLITFLSFLVFLTDTASADALGYGVGVIVVNLLSNIILIDMLPICGELLWVDLFMSTNTCFCCVSLFQSAFNIVRAAAPHAMPNPPCTQRPAPHPPAAAPRAAAADAREPRGRPPAAAVAARAGGEHLQHDRDAAQAAHCQGAPHQVRDLARQARHPDGRPLSGEAQARGREGHLAEGRGHARGGDGPPRRHTHAHTHTQGARRPRCIPCASRVTTPRLLRRAR